MSNANVVKLLQPGSFADPLTEVLRNGARALLAQAIEAEVAEFLAKHVDLKTATGLSRVVRHGHLPEREVMTGIGPVGVRQPRVRDRGAADDAGRIRFTPAILPPYARRSRSLEVLIPILYLKGISTGDFEEALAALLGKYAPGLSASTIARLKEVWLDEHEHWRKRDLSAKRYVYVWADGIYLQARLEDAKQCILVIIGATPEGNSTGLSANYVAPTGQTVNLLPPGQIFADSINQIDMRFGKIINFGSKRANIAVDVLNLFNANTGTAFQQTYGDGSQYLKPAAILNPRFVRFNVTVDF